MLPQQRLVRAVHVPASGAVRVQLEFEAFVAADDAAFPFDHFVGVVEAQTHRGHEKGAHERGRAGAPPLAVHEHIPPAIDAAFDKYVRRRYCTQQVRVPLVTHGDLQVREILRVRCRDPGNVQNVGNSILRQRFPVKRTVNRAYVDAVYDVHRHVVLHAVAI